MKNFTPSAMHQVLKLLFMTMCILLFSQANFAQYQTRVFEDWMTGQGTQDMYYESKSATDSQKNVYVVGASINIMGNYDMLIVKHDSRGTILWTDQVDGSAGGDDYATDLVIDSNDNLIVTGAVDNGQTSYDLITRKYTPQGTLYWSVEHNGAANSYEGGTCVTIDSQNNIYVGGGTFSTTSLVDYLIVKYNSSGVQQWLTTYDYTGLYDAGKYRYYWCNKKNWRKCGEHRQTDRHFCG